MCTSQYEAKVRAQLECALRALGAVVTRRLFSDTHLVVCEDARSHKAQAARQANLPVVRAAWVLECLRSQRLPPLHAGAQLPILAGCVLTSTGLDATQRAHLAVLATSHGALYQASLTSDCTHVVCGPALSTAGVVAASPKCVAALQNHIAVVSPAWLLDSLRNRRPLPVRPYLMCPANTTSSVCAAGGANRLGMVNPACGQSEFAAMTPRRVSSVW